MRDAHVNVRQNVTKMRVNSIWIDSKESFECFGSDGDCDHAPIPGGPIRRANEQSYGIVQI